jgi:hypothetical protein
MNQIPASRRETQGCCASPPITNPVEWDSLSSDGYLILQIPPTCLQQASDRRNGEEPLNHYNLLKHIGWQALSKKKIEESIRCFDPLAPSLRLNNVGLQDLTLVLLFRKEYMMAKYGKSAQRSVKRAMHKLKEGTLKSGKSGTRVKSRQQAIAIGLSEARRKEAKVSAE